MSLPDPDGPFEHGTPTEYRITAHPYILGGAVELRVDWQGGFPAGAWAAPPFEAQVRQPNWLWRLLGDSFEARIQRARAELCRRADGYILGCIMQRDMMARAEAELGAGWDKRETPPPPPRPSWWDRETGPPPPPSGTVPIGP